MKQVKLLLTKSPLWSAACARRPLGPQLLGVAQQQPDRMHVADVELRAVADVERCDVRRLLRAKPRHQLRHLAVDLGVPHRLGLVPELVGVGVGVPCRGGRGRFFGVGSGLAAA